MGTGADNPADLNPVYAAVLDLEERTVHVDATGGSDGTGDSTIDNPYATLEVAYNAGVALYGACFRIYAIDSGATGYDTTAGGDNGLVLNAVGVVLEICNGVTVTNTSAIPGPAITADNVISGSGDGVAVIGGHITLPNTNGDEEVIHLTGDHVIVTEAGLTNPAGNNGWNGIHLEGDDSHAIRNHLWLFDNDGMILDGCINGHTERNIMGGCSVNGLHLTGNAASCICEEDKMMFNTLGYTIDAGCFGNEIVRPDFGNNVGNYTNNGGVTNHLVNAGEESQILAGQTNQQDWADIYDQIFRIAHANNSYAGLDATAVGGGTSTEGGADIETWAIGGVRTAVSSYFVDISNFTVGALVTIRGYYNGRNANPAAPASWDKFYHQTFTVPVAPPGGTTPRYIPIIEGDMSFFYNVRWEVFSNNAGDNNVTVPTEVM